MRSTTKTHSVVGRVVMGAAALLAILPHPSDAQRVSPDRFVHRPPPVSSFGATVTDLGGMLATGDAGPLGVAARRALASDSAASVARPTSWAILASAIVPGAGQALLRQRRAIVYVALEAFALSSYNSHTRVARRTRNEYRSLASAVARSPFSTSRPVGDFDYYERMEHFASSGAFDLAGGAGGLQPEVDSTTFNGATWLLARRTYWKNPFQPPERGSAEWAKAEQFYLQRAVRPEYRWSWAGADGEYSRFRQLIRRSNEGYRSAVADLGVALGNHVLSAIDASVSLRLAQRRTALGRSYDVSVAIPLAFGH